MTRPANDMELRRVLVGIDGSPQSQAALDWAVSLARLAGAEVVAVHAVGLLAHLGPGEVVPADSHRGELEWAFASWCAPLSDAGVEHRCILVDGPPAIALLDAATQEDCDVVVLGSRGMGRAPWQVLGSTSQRVVQMSARPVLVVPSNGEERAGG